MEQNYHHIEEESFLACEPSAWGGSWTEGKVLQGEVIQQLPQKAM